MVTIIGLDFFGFLAQFGIETGFQSCAMTLDVRVAKGRHHALPSCCRPPERKYIEQ
jgi:hypothetical protein